MKHPRKIDIIAGARPNFMKAAPLYDAFVAAGGFEPRIIHTGQHYDAAMSKVFFEDLQMPRPGCLSGGWVWDTWSPNGQNHTCL